MRPAIVPSAGGQILYDAHSVSDPERELFDTGRFPADSDLTGPEQPNPFSGGRGSVRLRRLHDGTEAAVRHFWRGGLVAHLSADRYLRVPLRQPRPWREWWLLAQLHEMGLPVPLPIAARVRYSGAGYRGDLATRLIPDCRTLAETLQARSLAPGTWAAIGETIQRFHLWGADQPDLNAHNILLGQGERVYILDFDRGRLRHPDLRWQQGNLRRLHRSLTKLSGLGTGFHFGPEDWAALMEGYSGDPAGEALGHRALSSAR